MQPFCATRQRGRVSTHLGVSAILCNYSIDDDGLTKWRLGT